MIQIHFFSPLCVRDLSCDFQKPLITKKMEKRYSCRELMDTTVNLGKKK